MTSYWSHLTHRAGNRTSPTKAIMGPLVLLIFTLALVTLTLSCPFSLHSGDVSSTTAIFQASFSHPSCRLDAASLSAAATVEVSTTSNFTTYILNSSVSIVAYRGIDPREFPGSYVAKISLSDLTPSTRYHYRFTSETGIISPIGSFKTLHAADDSSPFNFIHMSCANANPYPIAAAIKAYANTQDPDFALFNGDVVYADRFWVPDDAEFDNVVKCCKQPVPTADYYRSLYEDQRDDVYAGEGFPEVLRTVATFFNWDDHGVNDDYAGQDGDARITENVIPAAGAMLPDRVPKRLVEAQYLLGYEAFFENSAVTPGDKLQEADTAEGLRNPETRKFRRFRPHPDVEVFILDLRQYRDIPVPSVGLLPILPTGLTADTLCAADSNPELSIFCNSLPKPIIDQEGYRDANKTLLGPEQKQWLKKSLGKSDAKFKLVVSSVMILEWYLAPSDRWEGYYQERQEVLDFIENENIQNVVFLVGDVHASIYSRVNPGRAPAIYEFTTGPIGGSTLGSSMGSLAAPLAMFIKTIGGNGHLLPDGEEKPVKFVNLDKSNFMSVSYNDNKLIIRAIGMDGKIVVDNFGTTGEFVLEAEETLASVEPSVTS